MLQQYAWPGNVRELRNVIERLMIMVPGDAISAADLGFLNVAPAARVETVEPRRGRRCMRRATTSSASSILRTLGEQQGNMSRTADVLGVERSNLYRKMKAFGIAPSRRIDGDDDAWLERAGRGIVPGILALL